MATWRQVSPPDSGGTAVTGTLRIDPLADDASDRWQTYLHSPEGAGYLAAHTATKQAAECYAAAPEAVLVCVLARVSLSAPLDWRLPHTGSGPPKPAALYSVIVGESGDSKSSAMAAARRLAPHSPLVDDGSPASAQALMLRIRGTKEDPDNDGEYLNGSTRMWCEWDEGGKLWTDTSRDGSSLGETLKSGWSAERLANETKDASAWVAVRRDSYLLAMCAAAVRPVLEAVKDTAGGFLQRCLLASAMRSAPNDETAEWPQWTAQPRWDAGPKITVQARKELKALRDHRTQHLDGDLPEPWEPLRHPYDGHLGQMRLRVAAVMSAMCGDGGHITDAAWHTSWIVMSTAAITVRLVSGMTAGLDLPGDPMRALERRLLARAEQAEYGDEWRPRDVNRALHLHRSPDAAALIRKRRYETPTAVARALLQRCSSGEQPFLLEIGDDLFKVVV